MKEEAKWSELIIQSIRLMKSCGYLQFYPTAPKSAIGRLPIKHPEKSLTQK